VELVLTDEHVMLQKSFRDLFTKQCPPDVVRSFHDDRDPKVIEPLWTSLASTGFFGLAIPEEHGGDGAELFDLGLVIVEAGRALCPTPVYSTVGFAHALNVLGSDEQRAAWLPRVARGELVATVALSNPSDGSDVLPRIQATKVLDGWRLNGDLEFVTDADHATELLVAAAAGGGDGPERLLCFVVQPHPASVERMRTMSGDSQCVVRFDGVVIDDPLRVIGADTVAGVSPGELARVSNALTALQTMEMIGGAQAILDRTVDYVVGREQFGRPLAGFQAVQHHIADMHLAIEAARFTAYQATWWTSHGSLAEREVAIAKLKANQAYKGASLTAHQLHGGMGYMREFDLHLWSERAKCTELLAGSSPTVIRRLGRSVAPARRP
jgi:alkylation response protein AidB-like acyl-CoA dehydrogenase